MKTKEKKMLLSHLKKDDKEFRSQIKDDMKFKKEIKKAKIEPKEHERKGKR